MQASAKIVPFPLQIAAPQEVVSRSPEPARSMPPLVEPAPHSDLPNALDLYPDHAELISKLRRVGVPRLFGIFDQEAWATTTREADLYRLPLSGNARADLSGVTRLLEQELGRSLLYALGLVSRNWQIGRTLPGLVRDLEASGELLPMLFPKFAEPEWGERVQVTYPAIPQDMWRLAHQARLVGGRLEVAAPGNAIQFVNLGKELAAASIQRTMARTIDADPILTMRVDESVVVLGRYGEAETLAMATLIEVLEGMAARL